jgi:aerobic-type carbon monoxide dehydrogenase small subunit (CoxS/CutS family)
VLTDAGICLPHTAERIGKRIDTTGGLAGGPNLHALQDAFIRFAALTDFAPLVCY